jgi:hypothetical protein
MFGLLTFIWLFCLGAAIVSSFRRKGSKKYWIAVGVVFALMLVAAPKSSETGDKHVAESSSQSKSQQNTTTISFDNGKKMSGTVVDETVYGIIDAKITDSIGGNEYVEGTKPSGRFVILTLVVQNESHKTREIALSQATLTDSSGDTYSTSSEGETALLMSGDKSAEFLLSEIQPHLTKYLDIVFDVPTGRKAFTLTIPHGMLSGGEDGTLAVRL